MKLAIYPGTFDPITYGHVDLIKRALKIFDKVIVAVARNHQKNPLFSLEERLKLVKDTLNDLRGVEIVSFDGLAVDFVRSQATNVMIRGLRMISDFEYEFQMALTNRKLADDIETIFMMPSESYAYLSSKLIKEAASLGADLGNFIPPSVEEALKKKFKVK
ncbi:MAG: pantetheine-phosphate adenylyltransferase [Candidatus Omnitrophota bacterium]